MEISGTCRFCKNFPMSDGKMIHSPGCPNAETGSIRERRIEAWAAGHNGERRGYSGDADRAYELGKREKRWGR